MFAIPHLIVQPSLESYFSAERCDRSAVSCLTAEDGEQSADIGSDQASLGLWNHEIQSDDNHRSENEPDCQSETGDAVRESLHIEVIEPAPPSLQDIPMELMPYITDCLELADVTRLASLNKNSVFTAAVLDAPGNIKVCHREKLASILKNNPRLARVCLSGPINNADLQLLTSAKGLKEIDLLHCDLVRDSSLEVIGALHSLEKIVINCRNVTDLGLSYLAQLPAVRSLHLENCEQITDAGLAELGKISSLRALTMRADLGWDITDTGIGHLGKLKQLEALTLVAKSLQQSLIVTDAGLEHIGNLSLLKSLDIVCWGTSINVTNNGLAHLGKLVRLEFLKLGGFRGITNEGFAILHSFPFLTSLSLSQCRKINAEVLDYLKRPESLTTLELCSGSNVSEACMRRISALPSLRRLCLINNFSTRTAARSSPPHLRFTDAMLEKLHGLPLLEKLSLAGNQFITGRGLKQLTNFPALKVVDLDRCLVERSDTKPLCRASISVTGLFGQERRPKEDIQGWCTIL